MSSVRGDLDLLGLHNLLQALAAQRAQGYLTVEDAGQSKTLDFSPGGIRLIRGGRHARPLGEILIRAGKITPEQLEEFLAEQRTSGVPLGEIVAGRGIVPREVIQSALRKQVAEEVHDLFTWTGASFEFRSNGEAPPDQGPASSVVLDANVMSLMLEAARRIDELEQIRSIIPDERLVPWLLELPGELSDPGLDRETVEDVLPLVDGDRSVGQIMDASLYPQYTVLRTLYGLAQVGVIKIRERREEGPVTVLRRPATAEEERSTRGRAILVLSDAATFRKALAWRLKGEGYGVLEDGHAYDVERVAEGGRVDAVVLDAELGKPAVLELCARIQSHFVAPLLVVTGDRGRPAISHALSSGARFILLKPLDEELLLERVATAVAG